MNKSIAFILGVLAAGSAPANVPVPNHTIYGQVTSFGQPVSDGTQVTLRLAGTDTDLVTYVTGDELSLGGRYALRIPLIIADSAIPGFARTGDTAQISVAGIAVGELVIGDFGKEQEFALDPGTNGSVPQLTASATSAGESDAMATIFITLSEAADGAVTFDWATMDGSALGGTCPGADYAGASGDATILAGVTQTQVIISLCDDSAVEGDETFSLELSNVLGAIASVTSVEITIVDDDFSGPQLRIADVVTIEPATGQQSYLAQARLGSPATVAGAITFSTSAGTAEQDVDYQGATNATVNYGVGATLIEVPVTINADDATESEETFQLQISSAPGLSVLRGVATATIIDAGNDAERQPEQVQQDGVGGVEGLGGLTALYLSADGTQLFAAGADDEMITRFNRSETTGRLTFAQASDATTSGVSNFTGLSSLSGTDDGSIVYAATSASGAVQILTADTLLAGPSAPNAPALAGASQMVRSPDGRHLYVTASDASTVSVFAINASTGALASRQTLTDGQGGLSGLGGADALAITSDGATVYAAGSSGNAIAIFARDTGSGSPTFGQLTQTGQYQNSAVLDTITDLVVTPDRQHLYAASTANGMIAIFQRAADGSLALIDEVDGLTSPGALAVSPDGLLLVLADFEADNLRIYERQRSGTLVLASVRQNGEAGISGLDGPVDLVWDPDSRFLYVANTNSGAILVFERFEGSVQFVDGFESR